MADPANLVATLRSDVYASASDIDPEGALIDAVRGQSVLITGAGRGIGQATAVAFAASGAGTVILTARSADQLEDTKRHILTVAPSTCVVCQVVDVTLQQSVTALFERLDRDEVRLDILVNNAGYLEQIKPLHEAEAAEWWKTWEVNVKGTFLPTQALLKRHMTNPKPLTIINISSIGALVSLPGLSAYQCTKTAVNRLTEFIHLEYGSTGVRAFAVHPGGVMTQMADNFPKHLHGLLKDTPQLAAGFIVWLCADKNQELLKPWQGTYLSANWDVDELAKHEVADGGRWGPGSFGWTRLNW